MGIWAPKGKFSFHMSFVFFPAPWFSNTGEIFDAGNKPVVAAIQGMALGGGLDVALFCHYRNALKAVRLV